MTTKLTPGGPYRLNAHPMPPPNDFKTTAGELLPLQGMSNPSQAALCNPANFSYLVIETAGNYTVTITAALHIFISGSLPQGSVGDDATGFMPVVQLNVNSVVAGTGGNSISINFPAATGNVVFVPWDASQGYELNIETRVRNGEAFTCNLLT